MKLEPIRPALPDWPRLMKADQAADYLSVSEKTLERHGPAPKKVGAAARWDRHDLDRWVDGLGGQPLEGRDEESHKRDVERDFLDARKGRKG